ncbi:MAG: Plug domain-containing protein, partial [Bacteroidota bacterium]
DGVQIRGGRVYETEYLIDGINAQDPLAGTGFGVDVNALAVKDVELITGGSGVEFGSGTSGVVLTRIKEGGEKFSVNLDYQRDNLGFNKNQGPSWNTDQMDVSFSGPIIKDKLSFFGRR